MKRQYFIGARFKHSEELQQDIDKIVSAPIIVKILVGKDRGHEEKNELNIKSASSLFTPAFLSACLCVFVILLFLLLLSFFSISTFYFFKAFMPAFILFVFILLAGFIFWLWIRPELNYQFDPFISLLDQGYHVILIEYQSENVEAVDELIRSYPYITPI